MGYGDTAQGYVDPKQAKVNTPCLDWVSMNEKWCMIDDLTGGTFAMRKAGQTWLPKESKEDETAYHARLNRSFLFPAFSDTCDKITSKPFSQPIVIENSDSLPEMLQEVEEDCDRKGTSLSAFGKDIFYTAVKHGHTHAVVDFPSTAGIVKTVADERALDARPFFVHVPPKNLIGWKTETLPNGKLRLTQIRIAECIKQQVGEFGEQMVEQVRVYNTDTWEIWQKKPDDKEYIKTSEGTHTFGEVPLKTYYTKRKGFMISDPPLWELAELNIAHWQSMSDQRNILRFARVGILFGAGFTDEEIERGVYVGPNQMITSTNPQAKLAYVEHAGAAIESGKADLDSLEQKMELLGMQPFIARSASSTATGKMLDESRSTSDIQTWIRDLEDFFIDLYQMAGQWIKQEVNDDTIKINMLDNFDLSMRADTDITNLLAMATAVPPKLSDKTLLTEVKRRGLLQDTVDVDDELAEIEKQGPSLASLTLSGQLGQEPGQPAKPNANEPPNPKGSVNLPGNKNAATS